MSEVNTLEITVEQAEKIFTDLIKNLLACHQEGEWISATANLTAGPKEGPILTLLFQPGTTKEQALGVQNTIAEALLNRNKG